MERKEEVDLIEYGRRIKKLRKDLDLVQDDIANYIGFTRSAYSGIEKGRYGPSLNTFYVIYLFFRNKGLPITTDYLFGISNTYGDDVNEQLKKFSLENEFLKREVTYLRKLVDLLEKQNIK